MAMKMPSESTHSQNEQEVYRPSIFDPQKPQDFEKIKSLKAEPAVQAYDQIQLQLQEWLRMQNLVEPLSPEKLESETQRLLGTNPDQYGLWVYYPWSKSLVHILDQERFINLRINRNQLKITEEESKTLATKKVGIVGLSVGQSVASALALERSCGEMRLADFDKLELTNLNRIQVGIDQLGLNKAVIAARRVAEIDPFIKVKCFLEGLTEQNIDAYFLEGGKLDLLIEECDSFKMKILSRVKAKEYAVPVLMDTSDRGLLDIERFDLESNRPLMHGKMPNPTPAFIEEITNENPLMQLKAFLDPESFSPRLKASLFAMGTKLGGFPQLGSAVLLGGAVCADVARRILLDQLKISGSFNIDPEEQIADPVTINTYDYDVRPLTLQDMTKMIEKLAPSEAKIGLSQSQLETLIESASLAPSGGNLQPWKWVYVRQRSELFLFLDPERAASLLDFQQTGGYLALGAATENLTLKAAEIGLETHFTSFPLEGSKTLVGRFTFSEGKPQEDPLMKGMSSWINKRVTSRRQSTRIPLGQESYDTLIKVAQSVPGGDLEIIDSQDQLFELGNIVGDVEVIRMRIPQGHADIVREVRWTEEEDEQKRDGISLDAIGLAPPEKVVMTLLKDYRVIKYLEDWKMIQFLKAPHVRDIASASAVGMIRMPDHSTKSFFEGGRVTERVWLKANSMGISLQPMGAFLFLFLRAYYGKGVALEPHITQELLDLRERFVKLIPKLGKNEIIFLFRMFKAEDPEVRALRRPISEVLTVL